MFAALSAMIYRRRGVVLVAGLVFVAIAAVYGLSAFGRLKVANPNDPGAEYTRVAEALAGPFGQTQTALLVLFTATDGSRVDSAASRAAVQAVLGRVAGRPGVGAITSYYDTGA